MLHIQVNEAIAIPFQLEPLERAVQETLRFTTGQSAEVELTLVLSDDRQLQQLNREFLGIDSPTDVLSFPAGFTDPDSRRTYLGDVLISIPRAAEQAQAEQKPLLSEVLLLTVHGVLHLLGYDHAEEEEKNRMWQAQQAILARLEVP